jgi:hypothetical protein
MMGTFIKFPLALLEKSPNKTVQAGSAMVLSKVIQNCPEGALLSQLDFICDKIIVCMQQSGFKAHTQILEFIISLVFHVSTAFSS